MLQRAGCPPTYAKGGGAATSAGYSLNTNDARTRTCTKLTAGKSSKCAASTRSRSGPSFLRSSFALHAGPNRWCASRRGVNGEVRDVSAIVWAYCRTDRCIQTSPHRLSGGAAHRWLAHNTSSPPVLPESQAVRRGVPPYSESRRTCPRMACAGPQPTGIRAI